MGKEDPLCLSCGPLRLFFFILFGALTPLVSHFPHLPFALMALAVFGQSNWGSLSSLWGRCSIGTKDRHGLFSREQSPAFFVCEGISRDFVLFGLGDLGDLRMGWAC